ncbi:MAG: LptF/LptG family permease [Planctomycetes bacterium]|nr:LptF/LptG family permease [Planctomycetota bacterium]
MILRISDRYIIRSFLFSLVICAAALVSLFMVVDTFSNLSHLVERWRTTGKPVTTFVLMILEMNATRLPLVLYELIPVLTLAAAMFTVVALKRANELTPLLASGVSMYRVLWPLFLMAIVLALVQIVDKEILIPKYADNIYNWDRLREDATRRERKIAMLEDSYGNVLFAARYKVSEKEQLSAHLTRYYTGMLVPRPMIIVTAERVTWSQSPPGWRYLDGTSIRFDRSGAILSQERLPDEGLFVPLLSGVKARDLDEFELVTDATPVKIETEEVDIFYQPSLYLLQYVHDHGLRTDIALDLNKRMAAPLTGIILLLIGLPFVLKRDLKSPFLAVLVAVLIAGAFFATGLICENFAMQGRILTPLTGAWAPIIIFGPIGALLFDTIES